MDFRTFIDDGLAMHIDTYNDRIVITYDDYDGDPSHAETDDEGVVDIIAVDVEVLLVRVLHHLAQAGVDVDAMLRRSDDLTVVLLPKLRIVGEDGEE